MIAVASRVAPVAASLTKEPLIWLYFRRSAFRSTRANGGAVAGLTPLVVFIGV